MSWSSWEGQAGGGIPGQDRVGDGGFRVWSLGFRVGWGVQSGVIQRWVDEGGPKMKE